MPNLEIECKMLYRSKITVIAADISVQADLSIILAENAIPVWMCQIVAAKCRKRNIGAISGIFRTLLNNMINSLGQKPRR